MKILAVQQAISELPQVSISKWGCKAIDIKNKIF